MDRVTTARAALDEIVRRLSGYFNQNRTPGIETAVITDTEHDHYGVLRLGWQGRERLENFVFLARIKDGKVWIEENNTDLALADELVRAGVRKEDIVLAFYPPEMRDLTEFAVA